MLSKMDLSGQMNAKSSEVKNESTSELFSAPGDAQESANGATTNAFELRLMVQFYDNTPGIAPKGAIPPKIPPNGGTDGALEGTLHVGLNVAL